MPSTAVVTTKAPPPKAKSFPENLPREWKDLLSSEAEKEYFRSLTSFLRSELKCNTPIYPPPDRFLRALQLVDFSAVRVVILGQDPYHGPAQATGLSFAVPNELQPKPPSLQNIFKELAADIGFSWNRTDSDLTGWAKQGVLLLNTVLSVRSRQAFSHQKKGWETFTDQIISHLNDRTKGVVFILWGAAAQKKAQLVTNAQHVLIKSPHPSPLSAARGFFGSRPFSKTNHALQETLGIPPVQWERITSND